MNDHQIDSMLDAHAWPDMPSDAHQRVRSALLAEPGPTRRRWLPLAATLLLGITIGVAGTRMLRSDASPEPGAPSPDAHTPAPKRVFFQSSIFASRTHTDESVATDWGTLRTSQGVTP